MGNLIFSKLISTIDFIKINNDNLQGKYFVSIPIMRQAFVGAN